MNTTTNTHQDPAAIEADIRRTQEDMSRTVDKIGDQLTLRNVFNSLLDKADENNVDARMLIDGARRNPMALGLIAAGTIWLVSDKDSKFPSMGSKGSRKSGSSRFDSHDDFEDVHHRDYVAHMSAVEMRDGEDAMAYQRRRDTARATFLMCEREPNEDDHSFRQRLDQMTEKFREKRQAWGSSAGNAGAATGQKARKAMSRGQDMYESNPIVGGMIAAAVGAAFASALPISRQEQEKLGSVGEKAREMASQEKDQITSKLREKKDEMVDKADQKIEQSQSQGQSDQGSSPEFGSTGSASRQTHTTTV